MTPAPQSTEPLTFTGEGLLSCLKTSRDPADGYCMTETTLGPALEVPNPIRALGSMPGKGGRKLLRSPWLVTPILVGAALIAADIQQQGAQHPTDCATVEQSFPVTVPKTHIPMIGWLTGVMDDPTALRDVMAASHPDVALTAVMGANEGMHLAPMGTVPATSGGVACVKLPQVVADVAPTAQATPKAIAPKTGKAPAP